MLIKDFSVPLNLKILRVHYFTILYLSRYWISNKCCSYYVKCWMQNTMSYCNKWHIFLMRNFSGSGEHTYHLQKMDFLSTKIFVSYSYHHLASVTWFHPFCNFSQINIATFSPCNRTTSSTTQTRWVPLRQSGQTSCWLSSGGQTAGRWMWTRCGSSTDTVFSICVTRGHCNVSSQWVYIILYHPCCSMLMRMLSTVCVISLQIHVYIMLLMVSFVVIRMI